MAGNRDLSFSIKMAKLPQDRSYLQQPNGPSNGLTDLIKKINILAITANLLFWYLAGCLLTNLY